MNFCTHPTFTDVSDSSRTLRFHWADTHRLVTQMKTKSFWSSKRICELAVRIKKSERKKAMKSSSSLAGGSNIFCVHHEFSLCWCHIVFVYWELVKMIYCFIAMFSLREPSKHCDPNTRKFLVKTTIIVITIQHSPSVGSPFPLHLLCGIVLVSLIFQILINFFMTNTVR